MEDHTVDTSSLDRRTRELPDDQVPGVVHFLQYEVREGREVGEVVVIPKAFIAKCNQSFILQLDHFEEVFDEDQVPAGDVPA